MINLMAYGWKANEAAPEDVARVLAVHRGQYVLMTAQGEMRASLKTANYAAAQAEAEYPTVGDWVRVVLDAYGTCQIMETMPRGTVFVRSDGWSARGFQAVAANFDYVLITSSLNQDLKLSRIERYLAVARQSGGMPLIILNKADLAEDWQALCMQVQAIAGETPVLAVSAQTGQGVEALREMLKPGDTVVFLGSSGVGKSSLTNALAGETVMHVNDIREDDDKGRHTTTHRQLIRLDTGLLIIDTPGMRELGLWDATEGLDETFGEVEALIGQCRFADCKHEKEPGCAIQAALADGRLTAKRWKRYGQLQREASTAARLAKRNEKNANKRTHERPPRTDSRRSWEE